VSTPDPLGAIQAYGADLEVFEEYSCVPIRARVVRDVLKVRTESGSRALKKVSHKAVRLNWAFLCAEYVAKSGFPNVPRFIRTRYGDPYVVHPTGTYYMTAWWPGRELAAETTEELFDGIRILGEWHNAACGFRPQGVEAPRTAPFLTRLRQAAAALQRNREISQQSQAPTPFERRFVENAADLSERLMDALQRLEAADFAVVEKATQEEGWVCHGDYTRHNITLDGTTYTVWNYEKTHPGLPFMDTALYLHRYMPACGWDPTVLASALERYRETSRCMGDDQILAALLAVPLRSMQVVSGYFQRFRDWEEDDFVDALESSLDMDLRRMSAVQEVFLDPSKIAVQVTSGTAVTEAVPTSMQVPPTGGMADEATADKSRDGTPNRKRSKGAGARPAKKTKARRPMPDSAPGHRPKLWGEVRPTDERE
jgi:CotS family spore coat protein